jgi:hypothetical protein
MSHTINTIAAQYSAFLKAGTSYGAALQAAVRETSLSHPELLAALAKVHAKHYGCNTTWSAKGTAVFHTGTESTRETRHLAAQKSWSRNVGVHFSTGPTTRQHKPVDQVAKLAKAYAGLTAAQKRRFLAML